MYSGKVLQGYGFKFDTLYFTRGRWNYISPGAFDESLKTDHVRMLLEHDDSLCFGDNRSNLILESDQFGLAFRCHLRKDKISAHVTALALSKAFLDCSIGFEYRASDTTVRTISKTEVTFITKATLQEISYLRAGACEQTSAVLEDADKVGPSLWEDCKASRLVNDNKFTHLMRTLRDIQ